MLAHNEDLASELFECDTAGTLTNKAARYIESLEQALEALVQESIAITNGELADHTSEVVDQAVSVLGN